jgi:hypothetical protein
MVARESAPRSVHACTVLLLHFASLIEATASLLPCPPFDLVFEHRFIPSRQPPLRLGRFALTPHPVRVVRRALRGCVCAPPYFEGFLGVLF